MGSGVAGQCSRNRCLARWSDWIPYRGLGGSRSSELQERPGHGPHPRFLCPTRTFRLFHPLAGSHRQVYGVRLDDDRSTPGWMRRGVVSRLSWRRYQFRVDEVRDKHPSSCHRLIQNRHLWRSIP